jgi:hypothetical protein
MKLVIDPMPALREVATLRVNEYFNTLAINNVHRDQAHAQKREWAKSGQLDKLAPEATLRGMQPNDFATVIASKSDAAADRELWRQTILLRIAAAQTPEELDAASQIG